MIIPKGRLFRFQIYDVNKSTETAVTYVPQLGYMGNAYLTSDVSLNYQAQYQKPLEGLIGNIPALAEVAFQAKSGISLSNNRFTSLKYWTGTDPLNLSLQLTFETVFDSFYDVFLPVRNLLSLVLPGEDENGFYRPPSPYFKEIANNAGTAISGILNEVINFTSAEEQSAELEKQQTEALGHSANLKGTIDTALKGTVSTGNVTNLTIGKNFYFSRIVPLSVQATFSSELCYAPLRTIQEANPFKLISPQYAIDPATFFPNVYRIFDIKGGIGINPKIDKEILDLAFKTYRAEFFKSYPIKAQVDFSFESMYPTVRTTSFSDTSNTLGKLMGHFDYSERPDAMPKGTAAKFGVDDRPRSNEPETVIKDKEDKKEVKGLGGTTTNSGPQTPR